MTNHPPLKTTRGKVLNVGFTEDEHAFLKGIAQSLGIGLADVVRDAVLIALCGSDDPAWTARENHVKMPAVNDRWRLNGARPIAPPKPPIRMTRYGEGE